MEHISEQFNKSEKPKINLVYKFVPIEEDELQRRLNTAFSVIFENVLKNYKFNQQKDGK